jgi:hypothetical protein
MELTKAQSLRLQVQRVRNKVELLAAAALEQKIYGLHTGEEQSLKDWWEQFPNGVYALVNEQKEVIGGTGIWPLIPAAFELLVLGKLKESQLTKADICKPCKGQKYWYFAEIILAEEYRGQKFSYFLMQQALKAWLTRRP